MMKTLEEKETNSEICLKFLDSSNACILSDICKHMHSYTLRRKAEIVTSLTPQHGWNHTQLDHSVACVIFFFLVDRTAAAGFFTFFLHFKMLI